MKKIAFLTQGCRLNQSETAILSQSFISKGFEVVGTESADIVVVNTCTVTARGDKDARNLISKVNRHNHSVKIAVIGCLAQIQKEELLKIKNVYWVVGNKDKLNLPEIIITSQAKNEAMVMVGEISDEAFEIADPGINPDRTRANLKIQDGCNNYCSYCIVPYARGPERSRVFKDILKEAKALAKYGYKEVVLTGINIGSYSYEGMDLVAVIKGIEAINGIERIRLSSIEPLPIIDQILELMKTSKKICRFLHIPLQSGSNRILKLMGRNVYFEAFKDLVEKAKASIDGLCIGTDIIIGFPGETKEDFQQTKQNLESLDLSYFHVFSYSDRDGTKASKMEGKVKESEKKQRSLELRTLSSNKKRHFTEAFIGKELEVLFEENTRGYWVGLSGNFIRVRVQEEDITEDLNNEIIKVEAQEVQDRRGVISLLAIITS
jgi:threonylcarbamoyladenosine tRNA methylthiotransferase MtaB